MTQLKLTVRDNSLFIERGEDETVEIRPADAANLVVHLVRILPLTTIANLSARLATSVATRLR